MIILSKACKPDNFELYNSLKLNFTKYSRPLFEFCWLWIFLWIKLSWQSCFLWDKLGWLNWFWKFLCAGLSSYNPKGFYYSYAWSCSLCEGRTSFCTGRISRKLMWLALFQCLTPFDSIDHLRLYVHFLILFHLT